MQKASSRLGRRALTVATAASLIGCAYGPRPDRRTDFVLFYQGADATLDEAARAIVRRAARAAAAAPELDVTVAGYEDMPATPESNQILSRIRAQTVANALVESGVERSRIRLAPRRAVGADPGIESHRVEIRIGA